MKSSEAILHLIMVAETHDTLARDEDVRRMGISYRNKLEHTMLHIGVAGLVACAELTEELFPEQILN